jgi:hypothetical protein
MGHGKEIKICFYEGIMITLVMIGIIVSILSVACGESNEGQKIGEAPQPISNSPTPKVTVSTFAVGDIVKVQDQTITMNSAIISGNTLMANFTVENQGAKDVNLSSLISFEARDTEGQKLDISFGNGPSLDGSVLPGDKMRGDIVWNGLATDSAKIYYRANFIGSGAVVWQVNR